MNKFKRKFFGLLLGGFVGLTAMLLPVRSSQAFGFSGGMSEEDMFNEFIEKGGGLLLRIIGYRYTYNWERAWDKYTEKRQKQEDKKTKANTEAQVKASDALIEAIKSAEDHKLKLETYVSPNYCHTDNAADVHVNTVGATKEIHKKTIEYFDAFLRGENSVTDDNYFHSISEASVLSLNDNNQLSIKHLNKLASDGVIQSIPEAYNELGLLLSDVQYKSRTRQSSSSWSKSRQIEIAQKTSVIVNAISKLISLRVGILDPNSLPTENLSSDLKAKFANKQLSELQVLKYQFEHISVNSEFINELEENTSFSDLTAIYLKQVSLGNQIDLLNGEIDSLRGQVIAVKGSQNG